MRLHELITELRSMAEDPDPARITAHAKFWADCERAFEILRTNGYGQPGMSIVEVASKVPKASDA